MTEELKTIPYGELLVLIRQERAKLETLLESLSDEQFLIPGVTGKWSVKDTLTHITAWEQRYIHLLEDLLAGKTPKRIESPAEVDAENARIFQGNKDKPLSQVRQEFADSYVQALALAENTSEEALYTPNYVPFGDYPLWVLVAANTCWHYQEHSAEIKAWLAK